MTPVSDRHEPRCKCASCKLGRVSREAATTRRRLRTEEANTRQLLDWYLQTRILNVEDFDLHIGLDAVTLSDGAIDFGELDRRLRMLIERKPYLAAA